MQPSNRLARLRLPCGRVRRRSTPAPANPLDVPTGKGRRHATACVLAAVAWLAGLAAARAEGPIVLRNVTRQTGIPSSIPTAAAAGTTSSSPWPRAWPRSTTTATA